MYTHEYLFQFTSTIFQKMGCSRIDAEIIAKIFVSAELRGIPSHGMMRLKDYFELWKASRINTNPKIKIVHETPSTAVVDGDNAIGMVAATESMQIAIKKAEQAGTGWVSTRNSIISGSRVTML
jgi:L-2-hydroxycarboxylate dehydrogenase (NAD+)